MSKVLIAAIMRVERTENGWVPVVFMPGEDNRPGWAVCYSRIGQHGTATIDYFREHTRNASVDDDADVTAALRALMREVEQIYNDENTAIAWRNRWVNKA